MAYRFENGEGVEEAFRRTGDEQLERAIQELTEGVKDDPVAAVHSARKALKQERALLRFGKSSLRRPVRQRQNALMRDAGQRLSAVRDADVMLEALDDLAERYAGQVPKRTFATIRSHLEADRDARRMGMDGSGSIEQVVEQLKGARMGAEDWSLKRDGWDAVEGGLLQSYKRGRRAMKRAQAKPTVENLHEWRKRAKDLWYHLRLLGATSETLAGHIEETHRLSDHLGDDHDLAVLRERVASLDGHAAADLDPVFGFIDHRRGQLQEQAGFVGARLYAEKPKAFARRLHRYWEVSAAEARAASADQASELGELTRPAAIS